MTAPGGRGETGNVYYAHELMQKQFAQMHEMFAQHPKLQATSVCIKNGHIEVLADGDAGVVKEWVHALPRNHETSGLADTAYGWTQAVVLRQDALVVTIRPPFGIQR